jgi:pimeloyl-ACP methyl ester carboxylesterase
MGTIHSRHLYGPNVADAAARGLRLISYDRPGYGGSAPHPGRVVADCAGDVRAICAALGIDRLVMWGWSAGGPHALACAALLPDLVAAVASLASPAPYGAEGLDWLAGFGQDEFFRLILTDPATARTQLDKDRDETLAVSADDLAQALPQALGSMLSAADAAVLPGTMADYIASAMHHGLTPGSQGLWDDCCAIVARPWGFELADISVPVLLLHGRQDGWVPFAHGQWLAAHIPGAQAKLPDHEGHLSLVEHQIGEVHSWLAEHQRA